MHRYRLVVQYVGTRYNGWQWQPDAPTVQGALQHAVARFMGQPQTPVHVSSRTDAGVHGMGQVAHVDLVRLHKKSGEVMDPHDCRAVRNALNYFLGKEDVYVCEVARVPTSFHARYNARHREYIYRVTGNTDKRIGFEPERTWHVAQRLDVDAMREAAARLLGDHDFTSFRSSGCQAPSPLKTLDRLDVREAQSFFTTNSLVPGAQEFEMHVKARSFLYNQVRNMVGALVTVGEGRWTPDNLEAFLHARTRDGSPVQAPAHGLYLTRVGYDEADWADTLDRDERAAPQPLPPIAAA